MRTVEMKQMAVGLLAALALVGCDEDDRMVARTDYDVPASWALRKYCGSDFHPTFYPFSQSVRFKECGNPDPTWDLDIFRECAVEFSGDPGRHFVTSYTRKRLPDGKREIVQTPGGFKPDYALKDNFAKNIWALVGDNGAFDRPFFCQLNNTRPTFLLEKDYSGVDRKSFAEWRAQHPNFVGFRTMGEFDSETQSYLGLLKTDLSADVRQRLTDGYPNPEGQYGLYAFAKESFRRAKAAHFGSDDIWTLHSSCFTLSHVMADLGAAGFLYEATGQEYANWRLAAAYCRGASRQWNIPFGWYTAHWYTGYVRGKYDKVTQGSNYWTGDQTPALKAGFCEPWRGLSRTMLDRQNAYGWLNGAVFLEIEDWIRLYRAPAEDGKKGYRPHETALDLDRLYRLSKTTDRGVVYSPCAILSPVSELIGPALISRAEDKHSFSAFLFTLVPVNSTDIMQRSLKRKGEQGCLFNSPFGDCFDILSPDSHQTADEIARALSAYKVAFLAGGYRKEDLKVGALVDYVKNGGTLVLSSDRLTDGFFPAEVAGVSFGTATKESGKALVHVRTGARTALTDPYKWTLADAGAEARVVMTDEDGTPVVYAHDYGKGRVVTVACWRLLPAEFKDDYRRVNGLAAAPGERKDSRLGEIIIANFSGKRRYDVIRALLAEAQEETMPVRVEGDIHWGVNKVESKGRGRGRAKEGDTTVNLNLQPQAPRWLLWLMNNKGVIHYTNEPEEFDLSQTARVKVTFKPTGKVVETTVKPGEWKLIEIGE